MKRLGKIRRFTTVPTEELRVQKYIASCGVCSRRKAEELIRSGKVKVNGKTISELGTKINPMSDRVEVAGKLLQQEPPALYLYHKPVGVISTLNDPQSRPCLAEVCSGFDQRVFPVGRLDRDVRGLLLLTNDGDLADSLLHPRNNVPRIYEAVVQGNVAAPTARLLTKGIQLEDGIGKFSSVSSISFAKSSFSKKELLKNGGSLIRIACTEGRKHFVKRMLAAAGHPVHCLIRTEFGQYQLGNLEIGKIARAGLTPG